MIREKRFWWGRVRTVRMRGGFESFFERVGGRKRMKLKR
jgi:hypothetical protein